MSDACKMQLNMSFWWLSGDSDVIYDVAVVAMSADYDYKFYLIV